MPTNLAIDDRLLNQAVKLGRHRTKREAVNEALRSYVTQRLREGSVETFGTFAFDPGYDYKASRRARHSLRWKAVGTKAAPFSARRRTAP